VQCDRQFDYPETCSQVTARDGNCIDRLGPQFIRNLPKAGLLMESRMLALDFVRKSSLGAVMLKSPSHLLGGACAFGKTSRNICCRPIRALPALPRSLSVSVNQ
jgi:hypothetical protein